MTSQVFKVLNARGFQVCLFLHTEKGIKMIGFMTIINNIRIEGAKAFGNNIERMDWFNNCGVKNDFHIQFINNCFDAIAKAKSKGEILIDSLTGKPLSESSSNGGYNGQIARTLSDDVINGGE